jgi:hypothetical protein
MFTLALRGYDDDQCELWIRHDAATREAQGSTLQGIDVVI